MKRWWKRSKDDERVETDGVVTEQLSEVRLVKRDGDVMAELSDAFGESDVDDDAIDDGHPWPTSEPESEPVALADPPVPLGDIDPLVPTTRDPDPDVGGSDGGAANDGESAGDDDDTEPRARTSDQVNVISIDGDDDAVDAVYLDDELAVDLESAPVFIDDDGTGDAIAAKDATGPGIEPRLRQRRIGVRRAEGRRRLKWTAIVGGVVVVVIAALAVLGSGLFSVDDVDVTGVRRTDGEAVAAVVDDLLGEPVLLVDTDAAEDELEALPYVEFARVRTDFPSSATIEIREREPVATARGVDGRFRIMDRDGRVVDVIDGQPIEFVLVEGSTTLDLEPGRFADTGYSAAAAIVTKLTPEIRSRLISMSVVPDGSDLRFVLSNGPDAEIEVRLGQAVTDEEQLERLVRLQRRLDDVAGSDTSVIDVSTAETTDR